MESSLPLSQAAASSNLTIFSSSDVKPAGGGFYLRSCGNATPTSPLVAGRLVLISGSVSIFRFLCFCTSFVL